MNMPALRQGFATTSLFAVLGIALAIASQPIIGAEALHTVPKASCGPDDRTESVQGQTTLAERFAPGAPRAYHCNLELVGQFEGEGASAGLDALGRCAYFSISKNTDTQHPGVAVVDVSHPQAPAALRY